MSSSRNTLSAICSCAYFPSSAAPSAVCTHNRYCWGSPFPHLANSVDTLLYEEDAGQTVLQ